MERAITEKHLEVLIMLARVSEPTHYAEFERRDLSAAALDLNEWGLVSRERKPAHWLVEGDTEFFYEMNSGGRDYLKNILDVAKELQPSG